MTKKNNSGQRSERHDPPGGTGRAPVVVCPLGYRNRFLRGIVTHDLMQRGMRFDDAYALAREIRNKISDREEITTEELGRLIREEAARKHGTEISSEGRDGSAYARHRVVAYQGERLPFSRGILARSIYAAGVDFDRAYKLVAELDNQLTKESVREIAREEIVHRTTSLLESLEGHETAVRYQLVRNINRLPRPLVIYVGGAAGTGKSTLSLELAPLLRIYRINATDTIRQVMRMFFSPQMMPAIHGSSYAPHPEPGDYDFVDEGLGDDETHDHERILEAFRAQASRVIVGVRAVVERAIAENMSILVEGVHLIPPLVPFKDLEGAVYQVPLILGTPDFETHRKRFVMRERIGGRRADRYLENFSAIRATHDFLLHSAEKHHCTVLDTGSDDTPVLEAVRSIADDLRQKIPLATFLTDDPEPAEVPTLLVFIDGLADHPHRALGGRTPLQTAHTPTFDRLAREGICGTADTIAPGVVPDTAAGTLAMLGQSPLAMNRGPVEALGAKVEIQPDDVALRANFATIDKNGVITDRRAGRIREGARNLLNALTALSVPSRSDPDVRVLVGLGTEHRLAVILRGKNLSSDISGSDPGDGAVPCRPLVPRPNDTGDADASRTARILALFEQQARDILAKHPINKERISKGLPPANILLTRGAGRIHSLVPLEENGRKLHVSCISGDRTVRGIARWLGAETVHKRSMTANLDTDLDAKFMAAEKKLRGNDLVMVHIKGADIAGHDCKPEKKVEFLEKIDQALASFLDSHQKPLCVAIASDHATVSESGQHAADPSPILIWGPGVDADRCERFDEVSTAGGILGRIPLESLIRRLYRLT